MIKNKNAKKISKKREKQTRYLSQAIQLEEAVNPHIVRATMAMVSLSILTFLLWAGFTNINEVAHTPGEIVPHGYQKTVQHLEGGIVKDINVQEGQVVERGQILVTLSDASIKEDLERIESKQLSLNVHAERLRAFVEKRDPDFSDFENISEDMIADQISFFDGMKTAKLKEEQIIRDQIKQKQQFVSSLRSELVTAQQNYQIIDDVYKRRVILNTKGYASDMKLLEDKKRLNDVSGEIKNIKGKIIVARSEIDEFKVRLESLSAQHKNEIHEKLDLVLAEKEQNIKVIQKLKERIGRMEIEAPIGGLVKGLAVNTVGAVVKPGQTVMEIVPMDKPLEVQVKISPKDVGHLTTGQPVQVKFSTYDFSRYGFVRGTLERISATTFSGENGERYYQGQVSLDKNYVGNNSQNIILPGMTIMADIITGEKTLLQYMLKPIHLSLKTAFTER